MIAELRETRGQLAYILDTQSSVALLQIDGKLRITDCNSGFQKMFSLSEKPRGSAVADFLIPGAEGVVFTAGDQEFTCNPRTGVPGVLVAHRLPHKGGLLLWCERLLTTDNQVVERMALLNNEFIAMQRDLLKKNHELTRLQLELEEHVVRLQDKNAEIERLIYTVSHDLRSPLVTMKTFLGYLESDLVGTDREQIAQDLQFLHSAADKMKLLLDALLEMSRIGQAAAAGVRVSLAEILSEVLATLAGIISQRGVQIRLPDADLMLCGDQPQLCQVWQNLIENGIKYCRDGTPPRIELGLKRVEEGTVFFVRDNGIGIAPRDHTAIFGVFHKLNPTSAGSGIGLSLVQRIVEKSGGRVWVESEGVGKGCCFCFTLPGAVAGAAAGGAA